MAIGLLLTGIAALAQGDTVDQNLKSLDTLAAEVDLPVNANEDEEDEAPADPTLFYDSSGIASRAPSREAIEAYADDEAFDYAREEPPEGRSFMDEIILWLGELFGFLFGSGTGSELVRYAIIVAAVVVLVLVFLRSRYGGILGRRAAASRALMMEEIEENVTQMDFDPLIAEAMRAGTWRRAVRLHYLQLLRRLADGGMIDWRREKTNRDYLNELSDEALRSRFAELTRAFDYVWYGEREIDEQEFRRLRGRFMAFDSGAGGRA